jgi:hypothetical protein
MDAVTDDEPLGVGALAATPALERPDLLAPAV